MISVKGEKIMISLDLQKLRDLEIKFSGWKHIWKNIYRFEYELTSVKDKSVHIPLDMSGVVGIYPDGTIEHAEFDDLIHRFLIETELSELCQKERNRLNSLLSLNPGVAIALTSIERSEEYLSPITFWEYK